jgi:hypothetical protein
MLEETAKLLLPAVLYKTINIVTTGTSPFAAKADSSLDKLFISEIPLCMD